MRVAYFYNEDWEKEYIRSRLAAADINFIKGTIGENAELSDAEATALSVFMNSHIGAHELDRFPAVKLVATRTTGFDHVDLAACAQRGVVVVNVPTYGEHTVAEFAMALLLSLSRRICDANRRIETAQGFSQTDVRGFDLKDRTIGIVGTGHIGAHMIRFAKGFGMNVIAYDVRKDEALAQQLGFQYVPLEELLTRSDVISLHAPENEATHHLINMQNYRSIKPGCYLINTARGGLVETAALVAALEESIVAGAGLDVLEEEGDLFREESLMRRSHPSEQTLSTLLSDHYLIRHPRVIVTGHNAFNTLEAVERILSTTVDNISAFQSGTPINVVNA